MIVADVLVRKRQGGRIEDARFTPEEAEQARRFLGAQAGKGPLAQGTVEQKDSWRRITRAEAESRSFDRIASIERGQIAGVE
jgi:hypothetical protein